MANILTSNDLVVRAVVNVIANAVEHSLEGEVVHVEVFEENGFNSGQKKYSKV